MYQQIKINPHPDPLFVSFPFPVPAGISLLSAGDMSTGEESRRNSLFAYLHISKQNLCSLQQTHSKKIAIVDNEENAAKEADGFLTDRRRLVLTVTVADCLPIYISDPVSGVFGILHSGWRGTGILEAAVTVLKRRFSSSPGNIQVLLGPSIGPCCYAVEEERAAYFRENWGEQCVQERGEKSYVDLQQANTAILRRQGIESIRRVTDCTSCSPFLGSFRRQGAASFTRMLAIIGNFSHNPSNTMQEKGEL